MTYRKVETVQSHEALLNDVLSAQPAHGSGAFWWMGQHTFIVKAGGSVIYIDPFFAAWPSRQTPSPLLPSEAKHAEIALVTHGHGDHLDPESLRAMVDASPNALFVCPRTEASRMTDEAGVPAGRLHPINAGEQFDHGGVRITAIKSKHESFDEHPELGFPFLGYVVEAGGVAFYHAGDTIMYDGLAQTLAGFPHLDAMFLPINGRDAERFLRGCLGNFTFQEAVELAGELRAGLAVPAHYDMFIGNQEDPQKFVDFLNAKFPGVPSWVGPVGERVEFGKRN
jgi:L-ascorbate metabolism protein UlaG (beta-lactamase superfamily)